MINKVGWIQPVSLCLKERMGSSLTTKNATVGPAWTKVMWDRNNIKEENWERLSKKSWPSLVCVQLYMCTQLCYRNFLFLFVLFHFRWNNTRSVGRHYRNNPVNICQWMCFLHHKCICQVPQHKQNYICIWNCTKHCIFSFTDQSYCCCCL